MARDRPGSFSQPLTRVDALYFAMTVFTTVGFGDIAARSQVARVVVIVQMLADLVYVGLLARVLWRPHGSRPTAARRVTWRLQPLRVTRSPPMAGSMKHGRRNAARRDNRRQEGCGTP